MKEIDFNYIAELIHLQYNELQRKRYPNKTLEHPDWESLSDSLKQSNIHQAKSYFEKLDKVGYIALSKTEESRLEEIDGFSDEQIEMLARDEHDRWYEERKANGWIYGQKKDTNNKISPYMKPYDELSEEIKNLDRDAIRNIFPLLNEIGYKIYKL